MTEPPEIQFLTVRELGQVSGYSHLAQVRGGHTVYLSGQIAVDGQGRTVGEGDFTAQARQVFVNLQQALATVDLTFDAVVTAGFNGLGSSQGLGGGSSHDYYIRASSLKSQAM